MASKSSGSVAVSKRYAGAFLDMAEEAKVTAKIEKDLNDLSSMIDSSADFKHLLCNPLVGRADKVKGVMAIADKAKFQDLTKQFLGTLAQNNRLQCLSGVIDAFHTELNRRAGGIEANVESAFALSAAQTKKLQEQLTKVMGSNVTLNVDVNKDLMGGMVITVGSLMIDDSVRRKLEKLGRAMGGNNDNALQPTKKVG